MIKMFQSRQGKARALTASSESKPPTNGFLFESFAKMLDSLPAQAVFKVVDAECRRLEADLQGKRLTPNEEVVSILIFNRFLSAMMRGFRLTPSVTPDAVVGAYRRTVDRLIEADLLPMRAQEEFENTFLSSVVR